MSQCHYLWYSRASINMHEPSRFHRNAYVHQFGNCGVKMFLDSKNQTLVYVYKLTEHLISTFTN